MAAAILDFYTMSILTVNLTVGPYFEPVFQIWCKCMQYNGRVMAKNVIFNMAAAAILDFVGYEF